MRIAQATVMFDQILKPFLKQPGGAEKSHNIAQIPLLRRDINTRRKLLFKNDQICKTIYLYIFLRLLGNVFSLQNGFEHLATWIGAFAGIL